MLKLQVWFMSFWGVLVKDRLKEKYEKTLFLNGSMLQEEESVMAGKKFRWFLTHKRVLKTTRSHDEEH